MAKETKKLTRREFGKRTAQTTAPLQQPVPLPALSFLAKYWVPMIR